MNLYLLTQDVNNSYDTYDSAIVCADDEEDARFISPDTFHNNWSESREKWFIDRKSVV